MIAQPPRRFASTRSSRPSRPSRRDGCRQPIRRTSHRRERVARRLRSCTSSWTTDGRSARFAGTVPSGCPSPRYPRRCGRSTGKRHTCARRSPGRGTEQSNRAVSARLRRQSQSKRFFARAWAGALRRGARGRHGPPKAACAVRNPACGQCDAARRCPACAAWRAGPRTGPYADLLKKRPPTASLFAV